MVERLWHSPGPLAAVARAALAPLSAAYGATMRARRRLYDAGILASEAAELPVISVGNLTVGGTGKTPVSAWLAGRLRDRARPAVLLRGYGDDEALVHQRLNPGMPVIVSPDRLAGVREARRAGADIVIADDAFQHRRMRRAADIVLLSVEQLGRSRRVLPAGPWREPIGAVSRADLVVLTRKAATLEEARAHAAALAASYQRPAAIVHIAPGALLNAADASVLPLETLRGRDVLAVAGVGEPESFRLQLERLGARVRLAAFRDHHRYAAADAATLAARVPAGGFVVCTLKDAVKLAAFWPPSSPLWYVSQQLVVDEGAEHLNQLMDRVLATRTKAATTAG